MSYPTSLDSFSTLVDNVDNVLAADMNTRATAIVATETKVGVDNSAVNTTLDYFLKHASGAYRTHTHDGSSDDGANIPVTNITVASGAAGDTLYHNGTNLVRLPKGTAYQVLRMNSGATAPEWGGTTLSDLICRGFELVYSSTAALIVNSGVLLNGGTVITKTANTTLTRATSDDWWDGATDSYAGGAGWCYIGVNSTGDIKFLGANPPNKADTAGNTAGTLYYWYDGSLYWRVIGAVHVSTSNTFDKSWTQRGNKIYYKTWRLLATGYSVTWSTIDTTDYIPAVSKVGFGSLGGSGGVNNGGSITNDSSVTVSCTLGNQYFTGFSAGTSGSLSSQNYWVLEVLTANSLYWYSSGSIQFFIHGYELEIR